MARLAAYDLAAHAASFVNRPAPRFLLLLLLLFVGSGCAALLYEIVWFQLLQLVIGSSAISLAVLLGTFMGGMCLGSLAAPKYLGARHHPLRVYAALELGIAACALAILIGIPVISSVYVSLLGHGMPGILLRAALCMLCLLPPTVLMGATLPVIARWMERSPRGVAWLGLFYGGNTAGAVAGCLVAGFYLLRVHDTTVATICGMGLNASVALIAFCVSRATVPAREPPPTDCLPTEPTVSSAPAPNAATTQERPAPALLFTLALSGFCALAAEVVWTRILSLMLGATVYTFSIILAVFLAGLAFGSGTGAWLSRHLRRPAAALAACQLLQIAAIAWAAHAMARSLPYWPSAADTHSTITTKFLSDLYRCAWAIVPAACLWGATFPLAVASLAATTIEPAAVVARAYAANTFGAIVGAVLASMVLIPLVGTRHTQEILVLACVVSGAIAWWPQRAPAVSSLIGIAAVGLTVAISLPQIPWQLVAYGRQTATTDYDAHALFFGEGMNSSVAVSETPGGARFFHVSGKTEASSIVKDMRLQRMLGHIPALLHAQPRSVLIVGCGAGVTSGSFVLHPSIERIVICDIEPLIPRVVATHFREENHDVIHDPRVQIIYDDARHYIATTREKFDIITSDPIHPWVKGSAVLYSQEYFELCQRRLNPGGLVTQWVPLYESSHAVVQSEIATFFSAFPHGTIWANDDDGFGYDTVMLGQVGPLTIDVDALQARLERPDHAAVRSALVPLGLGSAIDLLSTYAGRYQDLQKWLAGAEINRDRTLRLQYLAGLNLDSNQGTDAYMEILGRRRFPTDLFQATPARLVALYRALGEDK